MSQTIDFATAGTYSVSFEAAQAYESIGNSPTRTSMSLWMEPRWARSRPAATSSWDSFTTAPFFVATPGPHTLMFQGLDTSGGNDIGLVDLVAINGLSGGSLVLGDNGLTVTGAGNTTINGQINGSTASSITDNGTANLTLGGSNGSSYQGVTTVNSGTLTATVDGALGASDSTTNVEGGATLVFLGPLSYTTASSVNLAGGGHDGGYRRPGHGGAQRGADGPCHHRCAEQRRCVYAWPRGERHRGRFEL